MTWCNTSNTNKYIGGIKPWFLSLQTEMKLTQSNKQIQMWICSGCRPEWLIVAHCNNLLVGPSPDLASFFCCSLQWKHSLIVIIYSISVLRHVQEYIKNIGILHFYNPTPDTNFKDGLAKFRVSLSYIVPSVPYLHYLLFLCYSHMEMYSTIVFPRIIVFTFRRGSNSDLLNIPISDIQTCTVYCWKTNGATLTQLL